ncbi:MAG: transposase [Pseudobdellovibrionaceae bacterium]
MQCYDHYIAIDWSMTTMAIAKLTSAAERLTVFENPTSLEDLKIYLKSLKGSKILTLEESNNSQWLYVEIRDHVDKILVCDPYRNRLLSDGPKTDKVDATKLVRLLKADLLKEVFHTTDQIIYLRKLVSHYQDVIRAGVMVKNQRSAMFRSYGLNHKQDNFEGEHNLEEFVVTRLDAQIELYEKSKAEYEKKFKEAVKQLPAAKRLKSIPGVGDIQAIALLAIIIDPKRFPSLGHLYSYSGLIRHEKISGGRSYGKRKPRYSRELKRVIKMITFIAIRGENKLSKYHQHLLKKGMAAHNARHAVSRKVAAFVYGVLKSERNLDTCKF